MTTPEPYRIPRGRPANPFCPICLKDPLLKDRPHKRVAPGRKCQIHERSYMADYNRRWSRRNALRNERVRLEVEVYQFHVMGETEEAIMASLEKLRKVEHELRQVHADSEMHWPQSPDVAIAYRQKLEATVPDDKHRRFEPTIDDLYEDLADRPLPQTEPGVSRLQPPKARPQSNWLDDIDPDDMAALERETK